MHYAVKFLGLERQAGNMKKDIKKEKVTNYSVGDFLIRIKNAAMADRKELLVGYTNEVHELAKVLKEIGFLEEVKKEEGKLNVRITFRKKEPVILGLKLISKPGLRIYMGVKEIEKIRKPSILLLSTPKGILTSKEAIKKRLGGEVIAEVW